MTTATQTMAKAPRGRDLSQCALRAAMSLDAVRSHREVDTSVVSNFFDRLFHEFRIENGSCVRALMPTHRYVMHRALSDVPNLERAVEPERMWEALMIDLEEITKNQVTDESIKYKTAERLMRFCLAIHQELLHQREQRLAYNRIRR